jgi:NAD(P)-dependent dehydrogenase (short-subunit alcohol dehydrogenase family)
MSVSHKLDHQKVAIVTGAAGGIGSAISTRLAELGWSIVLAARTENAATDVLNACRALGASAAVYAGDVTDPGYGRRLIAFAEEHFGRLDGFVANAGTAGPVEAITDFPEDEFARVMNVNVQSTFLALKYALPSLRKHGTGSFVAVASTASIRGRANLSAYTASKHAVLGLVRSAAVECIGTGARVNAVLPGPIQTAMADSLSEMAKASGRPIVRPANAVFGAAQDVANPVTFLLSKESAHMNGVSLVVDAGGTVA